MKAAEDMGPLGKLQAREGKTGLCALPVEEQLPEEDTEEDAARRLYLIICIQGLKGLLFDERFHLFHIQLFYSVVEIPQPQDHTVRTEYKRGRV